MNEITFPVDSECRKLIEAMNRMVGIATIDHCCGHGDYPYRIFFKAKGLRFLPPLLYWFDPCHCGFGGWKIIVQTDCAMSPVTFYVEGPVGSDAYEQSEVIAELIGKYRRGEE